MVCDSACLPLHSSGFQSPVTTCLSLFTVFSMFVHEKKTCFVVGSFCGLDDGPLTMTLSAFVVVMISTGRADSEFSFTGFGNACNLYR